MTGRTAPVIASGANVLIGRRGIKLMLGERAERNDFTLLRAHLLHHQRHQLLPTPCPFNDSSTQV